MEKQSIDSILTSCEAIVTYVPLRTEVPYLDYVDLPEGATTYEIQPRAALDPAAEALNALKIIGEKRACILIPGKKFDAKGTRHGQGGGWYDRFLARVPRTWIRIGFCYRSQFSDGPLIREAWDQEMDYVGVVDSGKLIVYDTRTS